MQSGSRLTRRSSLTTYDERPLRMTGTKSRIPIADPSTHEF
jgi:hypothetical protein